MAATGKFYGKLMIEGVIECLTGTYIGTSKEVMEIGGVDTPVIRDPLTREPYIPGSSLKGKLRSLLEKQEFATNGTDKDIDNYFGKKITSGGLKIRHHECNDEGCVVCRLYGASKGDPVTESRPARLIVSDAQLTENSKKKLEKIDTGLYLTELKFENTLDRITSAASPRQLERIPKGTEFQFLLIYNQDEEKSSAYFKKDLETIFNSLYLLNDDAVGGNVSRGYGRIRFKDLCVKYRPLEYYKDMDTDKEQEINQKEDMKLSDFTSQVISELSK